MSMSSSASHAAVVALVESTDQGCAVGGGAGKSTEQLTRGGFAERGDDAGAEIVEGRIGRIVVHGRRLADSRKADPKPGPLSLTDGRRPPGVTRARGDARHLR
jgi:hypothetical protein